MSPSTTSLASAAARLSEHFHSLGKATTADEQDLILASRRMMRLLAAPLLAQMGLTRDTKAPVALLDSACGTGVFTQEAQGVLAREVLEESSFVCADSAVGLVELVRKRAAAEGWVNVEARVADAMDTGLPADSFSHVAMTLGLHLIPSPDAVLADVRRMLKPGGVFGATTFPTSNAQLFWFPDMRSAFESLPFEAPLPAEMPMQLHDSGRWFDAAWIAGHLAAQGFRDVAVAVTPGRYRVEGADEFMRCFGGMLPWLMGAWWSEETRRAHPLDEVRGLVRRHLEERHGGQGWEVTWEVISVTGVVDKPS
ncbi:Uncharacterized protein TPAR_02352 [Tolypocladium paradoxum]|uniref:Methyltransferase domain-containing protein n=1 Tax=Tolypocladium paradoxum TaxID=94208 RepID=A0A2S4L4S8_9HYPO|nr:Uncharacterized protein TPAR_02352 [Tolypocladium paradoxum]